MLHRPILIAMSTLVLGAAGTAQEPAAPSTPTAPAPEAAARSAAELVKDLGSDSFRTRAEAERALRQMGASALPELEKAVTGGDPEAQWRARRLVRQIERQDGGGLARRGQEQEPAAPGRAPEAARPRRSRVIFPGGADVEQRFDQLFRDLESDFGIDVPRARFFHDGFFQDLQQQMDDLQQRLQSGAVHGQQMSMQTGPDGVRVEVKTRNDKGEEETKVYEAEDMDAFREKYPEVLRQHGLGFGFGGNGLQFLRLGDGAFDFQPLAPRRLQWAPFGGLDQTPDEADTEPMGTPAAPMVLPPAGKRLGVVVKPEIPPVLREHLGLEGGLMVDQVQDGTLASALQLQKDDIVLRIGGTAIASTADVQSALGAIAAGARVEVVVLRRGKELTLHADKPAAEEPTPAPLERRKAKAGDGAIR